jgi:DNA-binding protein YbaB
MAIALPDPKSLFNVLAALDRSIADYEETRASLRYSQSSSDSQVQVTVSGLGQVLALAIDESQRSLALPVLADKVKDVINAAIDGASAATAATIASFATALNLPGLPAYGQAPPDYQDFSLAADQLATQVLANIPCESPELFACEYETVSAVVDAQRRIKSLTFSVPRPEFMFALAGQTILALNCAIDQSTERPGDTEKTTIDIINSKGYNELVLYANGTLRVDDRAHILGRNCCGYAAVANAGNGEANIGVEADVGSIIGSGKVVVRDRGKVHGYIRTASTVEQHAGNQIDGPIFEHALVTLPILALNVPFPAVTQGTIELEPGQQRIAAPGYYDKCHPKQCAQVFLSSGVYYFNEFKLEPDSKVWVNAASGPIVIWVKNAFFFRGAFLDPAGGSPRVFVGYLGTDMAPVERAYRGTLCAPNAKISLATIPAPGYEGSFHAKDIEVQPDSRVCFHPFELLYSQLPGLSAPSVPTVDLGFESVAGWSGTGAVLTSVQNPVTQGAKSLQITNVIGAVDIRSANFSSSLAPTGSTRLLFDLWVPTNQPNSTNWGTTSVQLSIPSAGISGVNLGTISITGRPQNQFSTFQFALSTAILSALGSVHSDVALKIRLDVTAGSTPWYLDNIRFDVPEVPPSLDSILSFEDVSKWSSSQVSLSTSTVQKSHLQRALRIDNVPAWFQVISVPFSSATIASPQSKMRVDVWLPTNQPNLSWYGQVQLFVTIMSAGIENLSIGPIQFNGLATGRFNTIEFALPANVKNAIDGTHDDVRINLTFNVAAGPGPYYIDNIRFV